MENKKDTAFFTIILFVVLVLSVINYRNIDVLESRINTVTKYSKKIDSGKSFKEDYYIIQQSHDTNLILVVFGVLVALSGFFTYKNIDIKFEDKAKELKNEIEDFKQEWIVAKEQLVVLKIESFQLSARFSKEISDSYLLKGDIPQYLYYAICGASSTVEYLLFSKELKSDENKQLYENLESYITVLNDNIVDTVSLRESTLHIIEREIEVVRKLQNSKINQVLSLIHSKLRTI